MQRGSREETEKNLCRFISPSQAFTFHLGCLTKICSHVATGLPSGFTVEELLLFIRFFPATIGSETLSHFGSAMDL